MTPDQNRKARALKNRLDNAAERGDFKKLRLLAASCDDRDVRRVAVGQAMGEMVSTGNLPMVKFFVESLKANPRWYGDDHLKWSISMRRDDVTRYLAARIFKPAPRKWQCREEVEGELERLCKYLKATGVMFDWTAQELERGIVIVSEEAGKLAAALPTDEEFRRAHGFPPANFKPPTGNGD